MKRCMFICLSLLFCLLGRFALAEQTVIQGERDYWRVEHFTDNAPQDVSAALSESVFANDELVEGIQAVEYLAQDPIFMRTLLHLRHEGTDLLVSMAYNYIQDTAFALMPLSDSFLQPGDTLTFETIPIPGLSREGCPAIAHGQERWVVDHFGYLVCFMQLDDAENGYMLNYADDGFEVVRIEKGAYAALLKKYNYQLIDLPLNVEKLDRASFPTTPEALERWQQEHTVTLASDDCYLSGANLRTKATTSSTSLGMLTCVPAKILGEKKGKDFTWVHVNIGGVTGWVADNYVSCASSFTTDDFNYRAYCRAYARRSPIARTLRDTTLTDQNGKTLTTLPAGTFMHVLTRGKPSLLVCVPDGALGVRPDTQTGQVGFIQGSDVEVAPSLLVMKYAGAE